MRDYGYNKISLADVLRKTDFGPNALSKNPALKDQTIENAVKAAKNGLAGLTFKKNELRGKYVYKIERLEYELVLRKLDKNIRRLTRVKQSDRHNIVRALKSILSEGSNFRIYKLDLKNFYETIPMSELLDKLSKDSGFPKDSISIFSAFKQILIQNTISGTPRGVAISATLSEYYLRDFDKNIPRLSSVYFYCRYVDDMLIVTTAEEQPKSFLKSIIRQLPKGLSINYSKTENL